MNGADTPPPRTLLEHLIRERRQTYKEFADNADRFAREHGESGTLSERHLKRLASGHGPGGAPLGEPRRATARLLERILGLPIHELLAPPDAPGEDHGQLQALLRTAARVDPVVVRLLHDQLGALRRLDRQLGAIVAHEEVLIKTHQVTRLLGHSLTPTRRAELAAIVAELRTLAGWQALDTGNLQQAWQHYEQAKTAARETDDPAYLAHVEAEQAFVLIDLGETTAAANLLATTRANAERHATPVLRAWLAAAHGEALAAGGRRADALCAFDRAAALLPVEPGSLRGPYVALDSVHLARWRGHVLARIGEPEAIQVLTAALTDLDVTFTRATTALHVDLATAHLARNNRAQAKEHLQFAEAAAIVIGSHRQNGRLRPIAAVLLS